ncbi:quinone-interacting membrane-bound oxidoreductase complex subunit QmoC [Maridesulfovibrio sp.]|uniref:quinone-interacting membrane-bound oxidoreductase complex subunit QmoC n=1 Tax=Maridesulfovibrio sp. TaxID=2795000 RepID=UPI0029CA6EEB|nr:quinone-interacting membrane-bound oxidoreductase complex subunit QmoC [Maridesulfovibrio sp.]
MDKDIRIKPDLKFIKELQEVGGESLKKCYQCATCSVACPLSPADNPYPRKEMVWAQWGLKDKLVNDIDIWLCHNCGQCSDLCPRGARPADLLAALRNMAYQKMVTPSIFGKWMASPKHLPKLIAIPAAIYMVIWFIMAGVRGSFFPLKDGEIVYGHLFPGDFTIDPIFMIAFGFMAWTFYKGVKNLIASFKDQPKVFAVGDKSEKPSLLECFIDVCKNELLTHSKWKECGETDEADEQKFNGHRFIMLAFICLMVVTGVVAVTHWGGKIIPFLGHIGHTPMPLWHPVKILANVGAVLLVYSLVLLTKRRLNQDQSVHGSSYYDWYLLGLIWTIAGTGVMCELLRLLGVAVLAYPMYYVHLIAVFMMFVYLPWSKLGHLVYRTAALTYARYIGRLPMPVREEKTFTL